MEGEPATGWGRGWRDADWRVRGLWMLANLPLVLAAAWNIALLVWVVSRRFDHPMDLEWMEGGQLYHAQRLLEGKALYGNCPDGFISFPYPPTHAGMLALVGAVVGLDYESGRLLSITAFCFACWILSREIVVVSRPHPRTGPLVLVALGAIAAGFPFTGAFYDVVRVDSVFVAWLFVGALLSLPSSSGPERAPLPGRRVVAAALCLVAAIYAKQTAVFFVPWICAFALWREWRSGLRLSLLVSALAAVVLAWLQWRSGGLFWTLVFEVMSRHPRFFNRASGHAILTLVFAPYLLLIPFMAWWARRRRQLSVRSAFWLGMLGCSAVGSVFTSSKIGAVSNNLITLFMLGPAVASMLAASAHRATRRGWPRVLVAALFLVSTTAWLHYRRFYAPRWVPNASMEVGAEALNREIASLPGTVLFPSHPFIAVRTGHKGPQIHEQGYIDLMGAGIDTIDVAACIRQLDSDYLVVDDMSQPYLLALLYPAFEPFRPLPEAARSLVGMYTRPTQIWKRRAEVPGWAPRQHERQLFGFESGSFDGWQVRGQAFGPGPTVGRNFYQQPIVGHRGRYLANSYHPEMGDAATGELLSDEVIIDRSRLTFRAGGGRSPNLRVELEVDGEIVRSSAGVGADFEALFPIVWDVADLRGRRARLRIVDAEPGGWGHILVDDFELSDPAR